MYTFARICQAFFACFLVVLAANYLFPNSLGYSLWAIFIGVIVEAALFDWAVKSRREK